MGFGAGKSSYDEHTYISIRFDLRKDCNCGSTLIGGTPVYLVGTVHEDDGLFYLDTTEDDWVTQTLPTTEDGKVYIYLGLGSSTSWLALATEHPIFYFRDGKFQLYEHHKALTSEEIDRDIIQVVTWEDPAFK